MDIRKKAVALTSWLHLKDAEDNLLFEQMPAPDGSGGEVDDLNKPVMVELHSPGSKAYARAQAKKNNRAMEKIRKKGKINDTAEQQTAESAEFLTDCTIGWKNLDYEGLEGDAKSKAVYSDHTIGFIAEQVGKHLGEWGNFSPTAPKPSDSMSDTGRG